MYEYYASFIDNYDGDTYTFSVSLGFDIHHTLTVRLLGCDTYEMKDKDPAKRALAKKATEMAKNILQNAKTIIVKTVKDDQDKYGRYLATITTEDKSGVKIDLTRILTEANLTTGKWTNPAPV